MPGKSGKSGKGITWITVRGSRVPIQAGESKKDAVKKALKLKSPGADSPMFNAKISGRLAREFKDDAKMFRSKARKHKKEGKVEEAKKANSQAYKSGKIAKRKQKESAVRFKTSSKLMKKK